jgi:Rad3-related DNA helicase
VVQAAGRVIRTPADRGVVVLLDDRYQRRDVRALLPAWWKVQRISAPTRIEPVQPSSTAITEDTGG